MRSQSVSGPLKQFGRVGVCELVLEHLKSEKSPTGKYAQTIYNNQKKMSVPISLLDIHLKQGYTKHME